MKGDIEVDDIDVDPDGGITIRGRITDPDLVAALTRGTLNDVSVVEMDLSPGELAAIEAEQLRRRASPSA